MRLSSQLGIPALAGFVAALLAISSPAEAGATFQGLGAPSGGYRALATAVSDDGAVVVGYRTNDSDSAEAFRWTRQGGMVGLGDLPGGTFYSIAFAVSADGSAVVGYGYSAYGHEPSRWTPATGMVSLGDLPPGSLGGGALGVSADGSVAVGWTSSASGSPEAFRWTRESGLVGLGDLPGGIFDSTACGVSGDGSVIVGNSRSSLGEEAFRWTSATGMVGLGALPGGSFNSYADAVSADGLVVVGYSSSDDGSGQAGRQAFRSTAESGMVGLGDLPGGLPGGEFSSEAFDLSADGSVIVGFGNSDLGREAIFWTPSMGMRNLKGLLEDLGLDLSGWTLTEARGISADGRTIVENGYNPMGNTEAWVATIPEPATLTLLALGGALALLRRRARTR
jgi:probable HAF family extracellular repeat protein